VPSGSRTALRSAAGSPLRSGDTITLISSPSLIMFHFQPMRFSIPGLAASMSQCLVSPSTLRTSISM
jgi:hypothetical protein